MIRSEKMFSLGDILGPKLADLAARAQQKTEQMATLADTVRAALPSQVKPHVQKASWRKGKTLIVMVSSGAWAAQVRFAEEDIRRHLKEANEPDCERLWVRVVQPTAPVAVPAGRAVGPA